MNYPKVLTISLVAALLSGIYVFASEMDERIQSVAKDTYVFKTYLKDDDITINSKNGVVTLSGTVNETGHKSLAQETIQNLPGVKSIDNQLTVKGEQPSENTEAWLSMKVKAALLFHRNVDGINTKVYVKDGVVTLKGEAESQAQKDLTGEYVKDIEAVKDVKNELVVVQSTSKSAAPSLSDKMDDASITAQVKMALLIHKSTSAFRTQVETKDGIVTVSGNAKSNAEKDLVTKLIMGINGVVGVHNDMLVQ